MARYGGEEFALLRRQTPRAGAEHLAHRVLDAVESIGIPHGASPIARHVTVSVGMSCYDQESASWVEPSSDSRLGSTLSHSAKDLVQCADTALYVAKRGGRAQAWRLDIDNVDAPAMAREIGPWTRAGGAGGAS